MNPNKQLQDFAVDCVLTYAKFNCYHQYDLHIDDLPDFILHEFVALIMSDSSFANEANGPDNPSYETKMLPALLKFMKNSTDRDEEIEFCNAWRDGVTEYHKPYMKFLIDKALYEYNDTSGLLRNINQYHYNYGMEARI